MDIYFDTVIGKLFRLKKVQGGGPVEQRQTLEVADAAGLAQNMRPDSASLLLYGDEGGAMAVAEALVRGSDDLIAFVGCEGLLCGHRQVAVRELPGDPTYENLEKMGFVPDVIVSKCNSLNEARRLSQWTGLGCRLICILVNENREHRSWSLVRNFTLQAFCDPEGLILVEQRRSGE